MGLIKTFASHLKSQQTADKIDLGRDKSSRPNSTCLRRREKKKESFLLFTDGIDAGFSLIQ